MTLVILGVSLALGVAAYSRPDVSGLSLIGYSRQPHDPGAFLSLMIFGRACGGATAFGFPIITTFCSSFAILLPTAVKLTRFVPAGRLRPAITGWGFAHKKPPSGHPMLNSIEPTDSSTETDGNPLLHQT
jgi:hypothetical protein